LGGITKEETIETPILAVAWRRIYWLIINLATAFLAASVVKLFEENIEKVVTGNNVFSFEIAESFEENIEKVVTLAAFLPIVAGMGGNSASQTMSFVIRNLALGEIKEKGEMRFIFREIKLGLLSGISLSIISMGIIYLLVNNFWLTIIMGIAMFGNLLNAAIVGASIPIILQRYNIDPAIASSVIVTTFTEMGGFFLILSLASLFMNHLLGV
jgi:magnesium transporter